MGNTCSSSPETKEPIIRSMENMDCNECPCKALEERIDNLNHTCICTCNCSSLQERVKNLEEKLRQMNKKR